MKLRMLAVLGCVGLMTGCIAEMDAAEAEAEAVDEASSAIVSDNALNFNALNFNALNFNALNFNALNFNALSPSNLDALQDPSATGATARQLMRYMASCALTSTQSFQFEWTDELGILHTESYPGHLGLAPTWATQPLSLDGQRLVSACLAARTNYYQVPVQISARSHVDQLRTKVKSSEVTAYPDVEGVFWGNLFAAQPYLNACYNSATVDNSRAWQRDCAVGHVNASGDVEECGLIHIVGPCNQVCQGLNNAGRYYASCYERPGVSLVTTSRVITTALP
jgi:hypothetical protein